MFTYEIAITSEGVTDEETIKSTVRSHHFLPEEEFVEEARIVYRKAALGRVVPK